VRIQADRGQTVVSSGPYAYVRHPGYLGILALTIGTPFALGSRWALLPAALGMIVLIVRTVLEDGTLQAELAGYSEYTHRVRSRLIPRVW
jgi:protein-S-isoprenylcysteine O-methyltransferase Ste14